MASGTLFETPHAHALETEQTMKLYLASISARRQTLLSSLEIPFEVIAPLFEEISTGRPAAEEAVYFAEQKARSVASQCPNAWILASDTLIELERKIFGKPKDNKDAAEQLKNLSGKRHTLYTAIALLDTQTNTCQKHLEKVFVTFKNLTAEEIEAYVASGEPMGKAGSYAIQGKGSQLIAKVEGDIQAVIGLPLKPIRQWLENFQPDPVDPDPAGPDPVVPQ